MGWRDSPDEGSAQHAHAEQVFNKNNEKF